MKTKKTVSILLTVLLIVSVAFTPGLLSPRANAKKIGDFSVGKTFKFGWYPQSEVTDAALKAQLDAAGGKWVSFGYYSGTGAYDDGNMAAGDWMKYKDVVFENNKYRAVTFSQYRPSHIGSTFGEDYPNQQSNGYEVNTVYWFKYEPIEWRVLDPATGLAVTKYILDAQAFNNGLYSKNTEDDYNCYTDKTAAVYATDYSACSLRKWLNDDFYTTAFSATQRKSIASTTLDNRTFYSYKYPDADPGPYDGASTTDKIFLLSSADVMNTAYGFKSDADKNDLVRRADGTAYAKCCGLWVFVTSSGYSQWLLRTNLASSQLITFVDNYGKVKGYATTDHTGNGVRPALSIDTSADFEQTPVTETGATPGVPCKYCGEIHNGFLGQLIQFFHSLLYFFRNLFK